MGGTSEKAARSDRVDGMSTGVVILSPQLASDAPTMSMVRREQRGDGRLERFATVYTAPGCPLARE
jgi:hypothetical protein